MGAAPGGHAFVLGERSRDEGTLVDVLEFRLGQERYAIETASVREVMTLHHLTPMPCVPAFIRGIVNVRGRFTAVLDLGKFFDLPDPGITDLHHVVLIESGGLEIGLLADSIGTVRTLSGSAHEGLTVLDPVKILQDPRLLVDEEVEP